MHPTLSLSLSIFLSLSLSLLLRFSFFPIFPSYGEHYGKISFFPTRPALSRPHSVSLRSLRPSTLPPLHSPGFCIRHGKKAPSDALFKTRRGSCCQGWNANWGLSMGEGDGRGE